MPPAFRPRSSTTATGTRTRSSSSIPAGNVVEYIARHDLKNGDSGPFGWADILYASEIGLIVDDVAATAAKVTDVAAVTQYKGGSDQFMAMGDEYGLLLVMKRGRVIDFSVTGREWRAGVWSSP